MIQIIAGKKGKGKTKHLLDKVNAEVKEVHGNIVYLDKSSKHMYELNNKVRLIDTSEFGLSSSDGFIGFICGIISQDHDLEQMYLDSFLKIAKLEDADITETIDKLDELGEKYNITFVLSISLDADDLPGNAKSKVIHLVPGHCCRNIFYGLKFGCFSSDIQDHTSDFVFWIVSGCSFRDRCFVLLQNLQEGSGCPVSTCCSLGFCFDGISDL